MLLDLSINNPASCVNSIISVTSYPETLQVLNMSLFRRTGLYKGSVYRSYRPNKTECPCSVCTDSKAAWKRTVGFNLGLWHCTNSCHLLSSNWS